MALVCVVMRRCGGGIAGKLFNAIGTSQHSGAEVRIAYLIVVLVPGRTLSLESHGAVNLEDRIRRSKAKGLGQRTNFL